MSAYFIIPPLEFCDLINQFYLNKLVASNYADPSRPHASMYY